MRISDWSSDLCSSDLITNGVSLQAIFPDRVILSRSGTLETLKLNKEAPTTAMAPPPTPSVPTGAAQMLSNIRDEVLNDPSKASRSEEHTSELQSLMRISYAVFCLKKKKKHKTKQTIVITN